jgi:hypothetical protein
MVDETLKSLRSHMVHEVLPIPGLMWFMRLCGSQSPIWSMGFCRTLSCSRLSGIGAWEDPLTRSLVHARP